LQVYPLILSGIRAMERIKEPNGGCRWLWPFMLCYAKFNAL
jgi:hypothetical protein